jgi:hypothetical protein
MSNPFFPPQTDILPLTTIRRDRVMPWRGEVLVRTGQRLEASDIVARAGRPRPLVILDVAQKLSISRRDADQCVRKEPGESVRQGETLAQHKQGLWRTRKISAPVEGLVIAVNGGRIVIRPVPELYELAALMPGVVTKVAAAVGVTIETTGALVQCAWGSGKEGSGVLKMGVSAPDETMSAQQIDLGHRGAVLVCGSTLDQSVLDRAGSNQVRGLIAGSVPAGLITALGRQHIPVIVTEGIGNIPLAKPAFDLLTANEGREAIVLAQTPARWLAVRPEIIIPLPSLGAPQMAPQPGAPLAIGNRVRIRRDPYLGFTGAIRVLHDEPRSLENGVRSPGAEVDLDGGGVVFVPYLNLELIGGERRG